VWPDSLCVREASVASALSSSLPGFWHGYTCIWSCKKSAEIEAGRMNQGWVKTPMMKDEKRVGSSESILRIRLSRGIMTAPSIITRFGWGRHDAHFLHYGYSYLYLSTVQPQQGTHVHLSPNKAKRHFNVISKKAGTTSHDTTCSKVCTAWIHGHFPREIPLRKLQALFSMRSSIARTNERKVSTVCVWTVQIQLQVLDISRENNPRSRGPISAGLHHCHVWFNVGFQLLTSFSYQIKMAVRRHSRNPCGCSNEPTPRNIMCVCPRFSHKQQRCFC
jgi:hypothetical protein